MIHKLVFDATDADTIAASHSVGAYLRASDGTLLTHTDVGGKKALDVRVAEGINVEVDLDAADDSVASWTNDGAGNAIGSTGGALHISDAGGSLTVDATDLDIRDLSHTQDSARIGDGTDLVTVTNVASDYGLDVNIINTELPISDTALANTAIATAANALDVANTAEDLVASPLANRKYLFAYNNGNKEAYLGPTGVSAATGFPIPPGSLLELRAGPSIDIEWVSDDTNQEMRTMELS
jgi:hypothetical protein